MHSTLSSVEVTYVNIIFSTTAIRGSFPNSCFVLLYLEFIWEFCTVAGLSLIVADSAISSDCSRRQHGASLCIFSSLPFPLWVVLLCRGHSPETKHKRLGASIRWSRRAQLLFSDRQIKNLEAEANMFRSRS